MYFLEWGIWKGRLEADYSSDASDGKASDFSDQLKSTIGPDVVSPYEPNDAFAIYRINDRFIDVRGAMLEEKRGLITFVFLIGAAYVASLLYIGLLRPLSDVVAGEVITRIDRILLGAVVMTGMAGGFVYLCWKYLRKFFRLELFTQRQVIVRFNHATGQVHINRPEYAGGVMTFAWAATVSSVDFDQPEHEVVGQPLMLAWATERTGSGFDEIGFLGEPMNGKSKVIGLWEYIRRYMEDGPSAVPAPKRLRPLWPSPLLSIREVWSFLMPMCRKGGESFSTIWAVLLFPLMVLHVVCHWLSMVLCHPVRWPKEIEEAGLPGKPIPKVTVAEDYGPEIAEKLRASAVRTRSGGWGGH